MAAPQQSVPSSPVLSEPMFPTDASGNPIAAESAGDNAQNALIWSPGLYNGAGLDRQRGNLDGITLVSQAAVGAGTYASTNQTNYNARGCKVYLNISAIGTGSVTVTIQGYDPVTTLPYTLLASTAKSATGLTVLEVYPGVTAAANASASTTLPRTWNVSAVVVASVGTVSFTVSASLVV